MHPYKPDKISRFKSLNNIDFGSLEYLSIRNVQFGTNPFYQMTSLIKMSLYSCDFAECPQDVFDSASNLQFLELFFSRNCFHLNFSNSVNLKLLRSSKCQIDWSQYNLSKKINPGLQALKLNFYAHDRLTDKLIENFTHSNLMYLEISSVGPLEFDAICLANLSSLRHFEFRSNFVAKLNFDHNFLENLDSLCLFSESLEKTDHLFSKLVNLKSLDLRDCAGLDFLNSRLFEGLNNLENLNLQATCRSSIKLISNLFRPMVNLTLLDLSRNNLVELETSIFSHTPRLKKLDLSFNKLENIRNFSVHLKNLKFLDLSKNKLTYLNDAAFCHLSSLKTLNLSYCRIVGVDSNAFQGLTSLSKLCLLGNSIESIPNVVSEFFESLCEVKR